MTVISLVVRVPVLSEQIREVDPNVSTQSIRLTSTDRLAMFRAASDSNDVTVAGKPCGVFATIMTKKPLMKTLMISLEVLALLRTTPAMKKVVAMMTAMQAISLTNLRTSFCNVDSRISVLDAISAMVPIAYSKKSLGYKV